MTDSAKPDLTSVRSLIPSTLKLARHLGLSDQAIWRWIRVNRIPGAHIVKVANFYDVEVRDLIHLTGSELSNASPINVKPKNTLQVLLEVYRGKMTLEDACVDLGITTKAGKMILTLWGDELPTLYTTLTQLDEGRITNEDALQRLNITVNTLNGLRKKYGFAPRDQVAYKEKLARTRKEKAEREEAQAAEDARCKEVVLQVVSGKIKGVEAQKLLRKSYRTVWRLFDDICPYGMQTISKWPKSFRQALAIEIERNLPHIAAKWLDFIENERIFVTDHVKYPKTPDNWRNQNLKRCLIGVLLGEVTFDELSAARDMDGDLLRSLFTSDLVPLGVTFDQVQALPVAHQTVLAEILIGVMDRRRKYVGGAK